MLYAQALCEDETSLEQEMNVGEILRRTRAHYKQSIAQVEAAIRVRASQIEAIENSSNDGLPGYVYAIGFVRSYAEYLGLDSEQIVELFRSERGGKTRGFALGFSFVAPEQRMAPTWLVVLSLFLTFIGPHAGGALFGSAPIPAFEIKAVPDYLRAQSDVAIDIAEPSVDAQPDYSDDVLLVVEQESWVEIKDESGKVLISKVLGKGEEYYIPNDPDLSITLSNAGGVFYDLGDGERRVFGQQGQSVQRVPLDFSNIASFISNVADVVEQRAVEEIKLDPSLEVRVDNEALERLPVVVPTAKPQWQGREVYIERFNAPPDPQAQVRGGPRLNVND